MENSPALGFVWKIALAEALASRNKELFPEHFLCALLKFVELDRATIEISIPDESDALDGLLAEQDQLKEVFGSMGINTTDVRHSLRGKVPPGNLEKLDRVIRRSSNSREIFTEATEEAERQGSPVLRCHYLLQALLHHTTPIIREVLPKEKLDKSRLVRTEDLPVLNRFGKNALKVRGNVSEPISDSYEPHLNALIRLLKGKDFSPILLIEEKQGDAEQTVLGAAFLLKDEMLPPIFFVDYREMAAELDGVEEICQQLTALHTEIADLQDRFVFLSGFEIGLEADNDLCNCFLKLFGQSQGCWMVGIGQQAYHAVIEPTRAKNAFREMWIHDLAQGDIPDAL